MKLYTNTEFTGYYPVGTAAIIYAKNKQDAAIALNTMLRANGLKGDALAGGMIEFKKDRNNPVVMILNDGNY